MLAAWLAQLVGRQTAEREVAGSNPNQGLKITGKAMLAVIKTFVSVQMIASLGGDVKPLVLSLSYCTKFEGHAIEPTLLFGKSRARRPLGCGLTFMGLGGKTRD